MKNKVLPKQIVYLIGAGATQAELMHRGGEKINLLMKDSEELGPGITTRILQKAKDQFSFDIPIEGETDIEKLISLLTATGIRKYQTIARKLRQLYCNEIIDGLSKGNILDNPELAIGLLELHCNEVFEKIESLSGIISLNHDNLFQVASQKVHNCINLGFKFESSSNDLKQDEVKKAPPVIQLHGSFNWRAGLPIKVLKLTRDSSHNEKMIWIPPTISKEAKDYPYNKLMGLAYELLSKKCNILRIIGCSLSQNDWNLISLLFNAQYNQHNYNKTCFRIELIISQRLGLLIKKEYSYLQNIFPIGYLTDGRFDEYKKDEYEKKDPPVTSELYNPFSYWLKAKADYHKEKTEIDVNDMGQFLKRIVGEVINETKS